ncbi:MAG: hypothetical protein ACFFEV_04485 [Candidatus Thorarchaeota archaeon]
MNRHVGIAGIVLLTIILLQIISVTDVSANNTNHLSNFATSSSHEIILDSLDWQATPISCHAGDSISGEFILTNDGDLFIGDQTKYDNWLLGGIDFLIIDAENYTRWLNDLPVITLYERESVVELSWYVEVPSDGIWYIIYYNDSIFMKQVEGNIQHISQVEFANSVLFVILIGVPSILALFFVFKKKK